MPVAKPKPDPAKEGSRLVAPQRREEDELEASLRPKRLAEFVGQQQARENLSVFIEAAKARGEPLDHVLFSGPPGLGKTTLAGIVAAEMGVGLHITSGPALDRAGDRARGPLGAWARTCRRWSRSRWRRRALRRPTSRAPTW